MSCQDRSFDPLISLVFAAGDVNAKGQDGSSTVQLLVDKKALSETTRPRPAGAIDRFLPSSAQTTLLFETIGERLSYGAIELRKFLKPRGCHILHEQ